jgi:hypothetical protein
MFQPFGGLSLTFARTPGGGPLYLVTLFVVGSKCFSLKFQPFGGLSLTFARTPGGGPLYLVTLFVAGSKCFSLKIQPFGGLMCLPTRYMFVPPYLRPAEGHRSKIPCACGQKKKYGGPTRFEAIFFLHCIWL